MTLTRRALLVCCFSSAATFIAVGRTVSSGPRQASPLAVSAAPSFEVASIKPTATGDLRPSRMGFPPGRLEAIGATVLDLVTLAYGSQGNMLRRSQVMGGPDWIKTDRFDIVATIGTNASGADVFTLVRRLLEDRFSLKTHPETRQLPIYELVMARSDERLGPKLRRAQDCTTMARVPAVPGQARPCAIDGRYGVSTGRGVPLSFFVTGRLSNLVDRMVIDKTGLNGFFDWDLEWTPAPGELRSPGDDPFAIPPPSGGPSIFTALEEQLGVRLKASQGAVDVLVIDEARRPTPN